MHSRKQKFRHVKHLLYIHCDKKWLDASASSSFFFFSNICLFICETVRLIRAAFLPKDHSQGLLGMHGIHMNFAKNSGSIQTTVSLSRTSDRNLGHLHASKRQDGKDMIFFSKLVRTILSVTRIITTHRKLQSYEQPQCRSN